MLALITNNPQAVVSIFQTIPNPLALPNGDQVSGISSVPWTSTDGSYSLVSVVPFTLPAGQEVVGSPTYSISNGVVSQNYTTQAIPAPQAAASQYNQALQAGITITWSASTTLNGTYALDTNTQVLLIGEYISTQNFAKAPIPWYMMNGTAVSMTTTQADLFGAAIWGYLTSLRAAQAVAAAGGTPTWPSSSVSITG